MQYIKCSIPQIFPPALKMRGEMDFQDFKDDLKWTKLWNILLGKNWVKNI